MPYVLMSKTPTLTAGGAAWRPRLRYEILYYFHVRFASTLLVLQRLMVP